MITETVIAKTAGAFMGSSIAVVMRSHGESRAMMFKKLIIGTILGVIFSPRVLEYFQWPETLPNWLSASVISGLFGYFVLKIIFDNGPEFVKSWVNKAKK